jgi:hypothetical protein
MRPGPDPFAPEALLRSAFAHPPSQPERPHSRVRCPSGAGSSTVCGGHGEEVGWKEVVEGGTGWCAPTRPTACAALHLLSAGPHALLWLRGLLSCPLPTSSADKTLFHTDSGVDLSSCCGSAIAPSLSRDR